MSLRLRPYVCVTLVALALGCLRAREAAAQDSFRVGLSFGGTGFVGVVADLVPPKLQQYMVDDVLSARALEQTGVDEQLWGDRGVELLVTTFSFHDVGVSVVGKQYFGASWLKPSVGGGLWVLTGRTPEGTGTAIIARFPLGADWKISGPSHLTWEIDAMRGLWVRRPDPADDFPITQRVIPIPAVAYRASFGR